MIKWFAIDDVVELLVSADAGRWEVIFEAQAKTSSPPKWAGSWLIKLWIWGTPGERVAKNHKTVRLGAMIKNKDAWIKSLDMPAISMNEYWIESLGVCGPHTQQVLGTARVFLDAKNLSHATRCMASKPNRRFGRSL